ncbi:MAG TPA: phospholipid carrier-dependent glycosyltransferase [Candidatus Acidoferrales bacterium]|nr:phospholipid carrier-dependent glycosyltransferase [Candidatus Acidoferrales bacterium]
MLKRKRSLLLLILLTAIGAYLHFFNLNWGSPFFFNPDERNIASAVAQLQFPYQMNPHFFAYGSLPIYTIYFAGVLLNYMTPFFSSSSQSQILNVSFSQAIIISRFFSALFATLLIPLLYIIAKNLKQKYSHKNKDSNTESLLTAFFATASTGFIQFSHFGTFEMWLTFFGTLLFWLCLYYSNKPKSSILILLGVVFGILVSVKVSSLILLPIPLGIFGVLSLKKKWKKHLSEKFRLTNFLNIGHAGLLSLLSFLRKTFVFAVLAILVYLLTNPYVILDQKDFISSMNYESSVALGTEPVFYTGNFYNTTPVIYQFLHVYPFLINPLLTLIFIPAFIFFLYQTIKTKNPAYIILTIFFLILSLSQAYLFVKWTRYMMPTLPFIYLIIAVVLANNEVTKQWNIRIKKLFSVIIIVTCLLFAFSYLKTAFINSDTRIQALLFATKKLPTNASVLSEPADLGVLPFQDAFPHFDTFNFYDLDNHSPDITEMTLQQKLSTAQYFFIPSQRILQTRMQNPKRYPKGHRFYAALLSSRLNFHMIYETPCDIFCRITYLGDPVYWWEQTVSVFDRPTVFIFEKNE